MEADELVLAKDVRRDCGDAEGEGSLPVGIDGFGESAFVQHKGRFFSRKFCRFSNNLQLLQFGDVSALDEAGMEDGVSKRISAPQLFRPFAQLLGAAAVEGAGPVTHGQPHLRGNLPQPDKGIGHVQPTAEEIRKLHPFFRDFRVQGKYGPPGFQLMFPAQLLDTYRIEIAPGSDVVEKDFEGRHGLIVAEAVRIAIGEASFHGREVVNFRNPHVATRIGEV